MPRPILCLLLLLSAADAQGAAAFPKCPPAAPAGQAAPVPTLDAMLACQQNGRQAFIAAHLKKTGQEPPLELIDALDDFQRGQMRDFLQKHPEAATFEEEPEKAPAPGEAAAAGAGGEGFLGQVAALFGLAKDSLLGYFGQDGAPVKGTAAETEARGLAQQIGTQIDGSRKTGGVDIKGVMEQAKKDPAGTVAQAVKRHKKEFNENLDSDTKSYFTQPGGEP